MTWGSFPPWRPPRTQACSLLPVPQSSCSLTKRTPLALPSASPPGGPSLRETPGGSGGSEKQGYGRSDWDNYNLGRFESQAVNQGGSSSCRVWELGLSQKPCPTAQPLREAISLSLSTSEPDLEPVHSFTRPFIPEMLVM